MKQYGIVKITYEFIHDILKLPEDAEITEIICERDEREKKIIKVMVKHQNLAVVMEGHSIPYYPLDMVQK